MLGRRRHLGVAIDLWQGDITEFVADAIVNAANCELKGGSGVDGAIHRVGGPSLLAECKKFAPIQVGQAVVTGAGHLPAQYVIHTVGPNWLDKAGNEEKLLVKAYQNSLQKGLELNIRHLTFPALSAGAYSCPAELAAELAFRAVKGFLDTHHNSLKGSALRRITFVLYDLAMYHIFQRHLFQTFEEDETTF